MHRPFRVASLRTTYRYSTSTTSSFSLFAPSRAALPKTAAGIFSTQPRASYSSSSSSQKISKAEEEELKRKLFKMEKSINVYGRPLAECSRSPITGFFRDGYCNTSPLDGGAHTVAAQVNDQWLKFSASRGNDLRPILSDGCKWCLCVSRWKESLDAYKRGELPKEAVPKVMLDATHQAALRVVSLDDLKAFAIENPSPPASRDPSAKQDL